MAFELLLVLSSASLKIILIGKQAHFKQNERDL